MHTFCCILCLPTICGPCYCLGQAKTKFRVGILFHLWQILDYLVGCSYTFVNLKNIPIKRLQNDIRGKSGDDCTDAWCCFCCTLNQIHRQIGLDLRQNEAEASLEIYFSKPRFQHQKENFSLETRSQKRWKLFLVDFLLLLYVSNIAMENYQERFLLLIFVITETNN